MLGVRIVSLPRRSLAVLAPVLCLVVLGGAIASGANGPKQPSEPFFPRSGNRGYDVKHYDVSLGYQPRSGQLTARDVVEARATAGLSRFSLDLDGLKVTSVGVDGEAAKFSRGRGKVKIVPATPIAKGGRLTVELRYQGLPRKVTDPDGSTEGWYRTSDGAVGVGEPIGTAAWLACNNAPRDKASFDIQITVPAGLKAVSNGKLVGRQKVDRRVRFSWSEPAPMASYLALVDIGKGKLVHGQVGKLPTWTLIDPRSTRCPRSSVGSPTSMGPTPSRRPDRWSTSPIFSTRWRPSRDRSTRSRPTAPRSSTRPPTSGSATRSASSAGPTSG
jgi:hypothetical protein